jgi:prevent-host-death family protein
MAVIVNMHQAKSSLSRLVERALAGEEVVISRNGEPLVKLVPTSKPRKPSRTEGESLMGPDPEPADAKIADASDIESS